MRSSNRFAHAPHRGGRRARQLATLCVLSALALSLAGCEMLGLSGDPSSQPPPTKPAKKPTKPPKKAEAPKEEQEKVDEGEYQRPDYPEGSRRNPFQPVPDVISPIGTVVTEEKRPVEPLEQFSISQLTLVAVISETAVPKAMFLDPNGFGHVIKEGDRIGRQSGVVTDIRDNAVDVQETTGEDENTQSRVNTITLRDFELATSEEDGEDLSEAERQALERLLKTDEGRAALRSSLKSRGAAVNEDETAGRSAEGIAPPKL